MQVTAAKKAEVQARRNQVLQYIKARLSYRQIAEKVGVSRTQVERDVKAVVQQWHDENMKDIAKQIAIDCGAIDDALLGITTRYRQGDDAAIQSLTKLLERRAKMMGYDAPTRQSVIEEVRFAVIPPVLPLLPDDPTAPAPVQAPAPVAPSPAVQESADGSAQADY